MPRKKQGLRSYHHKSRNGCSNCKRRRVKCNMQAPACTNCLRRNELCEYPSFSESPPRDMTSDVSLPSGFPPVTTVTGAGGLGIIQNTLSSYNPNPWAPPYAGPTSGTIETTLTFPDSIPISLSARLSTILGNSWFSAFEISLWTPVLQKSAREYQYVHHSILSLAALIDEFNTPHEQKVSSQKTPVTAYQHHIQASSLFRQMPPVVDEKNWVAVLAFGISMIIFHFAVQQLYHDENFNAIETFRILRTTMDLNEEAFPYLTKSHFWPHIVQRTQLPSLMIDIKLRTAFQKLAAVISQAMESNEPGADTNRQAFWELREWAVECEGHPRTWRHYLEWPAAVTDDYLTLLSNVDDVALLTFVHWCAIMYQSPRQWFITAWSKRTAMQAIGMLKADWGDVLAWPFTVFELVPTTVPSIEPHCGYASFPDPVPSQTVPATVDSLNVDPILFEIE